MLDGNILILVHPSSGDNIFYKVRDAKHIILLDSFRNEPKGMNARLYVLVKNKYWRNEISLYTCVSMRHNMQRLTFLGKDVLQEKNYIFTIKTSSTYIY